jgi:quercetin dioxygenase-like cupin family protein
MPRPITIENAPVVPNSFGLDAHRLFASPHVELVHIRLRPGQNLVRHASPVDSLFYVIEGGAVVEVGSERIPAPAGTLVPSPAHTMHRVLNETERPVLMLVIKTPRPTEPPKFE